MLNPEFIKIRIFAVLCHFGRLEMMCGVNVKLEATVLYQKHTKRNRPSFST